jgi:hypothetical protein
MKTLYTLLLLLLLTFVPSFAQNDEYQFAREVFRKNYKPQTYEPFKGTVTVEDNKIKYGEQVLMLDNIPKEYRGIFIYHANLFGDVDVVTYKTREKFDAMTEQEQFRYMLGKNDTISIMNFQQLEQLNPNVKTKRFVFWRFYGTMINPIECYFELQNNKATRRTPLDEFIKGATLTFFQSGPHLR